MLPTVTRYQKYTRVTSYKAPLVYFLVNIIPFPPALTMSISVPLVFNGTEIDIVRAGGNGIILSLLPRFEFHNEP